MSRPRTAGCHCCGAFLLLCTPLMSIQCSMMEDSWALALANVIEGVILLEDALSSLLTSQTFTKRTLGVIFVGRALLGMVTMVLLSLHLYTIYVTVWTRAQSPLRGFVTFPCQMNINNVFSLVFTDLLPLCHDTLKQTCVVKIKLWQIPFP